MDNQKLKIGSIVLTCTVLLAAGLLWLYVGDNNTIKPVSQEKQGPEKILQAQAEALPNEPNVEPLGELADLPPTGRVKMIEQLIEANMPPESRYVRVVKNQMKGLTLKQLIEDVGDAWSANSPFMFSCTGDWSDVVALKIYLPTNIRALEIIEAGRKDPERVGAMVTQNLRKRLNEFPELYEKYEMFSMTHEPIDLFYAAGHNGSEAGCEFVHMYEEYRYAIAAYMWIMVNIGYSKSLDVLEDFIAMMYDDTKFQYPPEQAKHAEKAWNVASTVSEMTWRFLCPEMTLYAMSMLVQKKDCPEEFAQTRKFYNQAFKGVNLSKQVAVPASDALYPAGDFRLSVLDIDTSSEPQIKLEVPNGMFFVRDSYRLTERKELFKQLWEVIKTRRQSSQGSKLDNS